MVTSPAVTRFPVIVIVPTAVEFIANQLITDQLSVQLARISKVAEHEIVPAVYVYVAELETPIKPVIVIVPAVLIVTGFPTYPVVFPVADQVPVPASFIVDVPVIIYVLVVKLPPTETVKAPLIVAVEAEQTRSPVKVILATKVVVTPAVVKEPKFKAYAPINVVVALAIKALVTVSMPVSVILEAPLTVIFGIAIPAVVNAVLPLIIQVPVVPVIDSPAASVTVLVVVRLYVPMANVQVAPVLVTTAQAASAARVTVGLPVVPVWNVAVSPATGNVP
jgi:hypothetical protein